MGYEEMIPPIPTRDEELKALDKLEDSWIKQSRISYHMNENLRIPKINLMRNKDLFAFEFFSNILLGNLLLLPFIYVMRRFYITSKSGVPQTPKFTAFIRQRTSFQHRWYYYTKDSLIFSFVGSIIFACHFTNTERLEDQYGARNTKSPVMM